MKTVRDRLKTYLERKRPMVGDVESCLAEFDKTGVYKDNAVIFEAPVKRTVAKVKPKPKPITRKVLDVGTPVPNSDAGSDSSGK